jgi:hypothetical protein
LINNCKSLKIGSYDNLDKNGFVREGTTVKGNDIIIGKIIPESTHTTRQDRDVVFKDNSTIIRSTEAGVVDRGIVTTNQDDYRLAKVRIRQKRECQIGDKLASFSAQKGIIGMTYRQEDMPYTSTGICPDIIVNPHALPSRMTIAQLLECVMGKACSLEGKYGDGTPFQTVDQEHYGDILESYGFQRYGNETLYNGMTGKRMKVQMFIGPTFYQRLKHMVSDKMHMRARGPVQNLTRQAAEGRSRNGGLRFGEMEKDQVSLNTPITLDNSLAVEISEMKDCNNTVLGWDKNTGTMVPSKQTQYLDKEKRPFMKLTLSDSRTIECGNFHPFLTDSSEFVRAQFLKTGDYLQTGIQGVLVHMKQEINESKNWQYTFGDITLKMDTNEQYLRSMTIARIIGYIITDGHMNANNNTMIFMGHTIDVQKITSDLDNMNILYSLKKIDDNNTTINLLKCSFKNSILQLPGIVIGNKTEQPRSLPEFILDPSCPLPIVREFLGGMFGGDGHTCSLSKRRDKYYMKGISYSNSVSLEFIDSLNSYIKNMQKLLGRFDIESTIQVPKENSASKIRDITNDKRKYEVVMCIPITNLLKFHEKIGFRYCSHKTMRLDIGASYRRLVKKSIEQESILINRANEIKKSNCTWDIAIKQSIDELQKIEYIFHKSSIPNHHTIRDRLVSGNKNQGNIDIIEFLDSIGATDRFTNKYSILSTDINLPTLNYKIVKIEDIGLQIGADIQVENTESFLANGIVAHNCLIAHGASKFLWEKLFTCSDEFYTTVCDKCGNFATDIKDSNIKICQKCENYTEFSTVAIPYAAKLLFMELQCMGIYPRIKTK